MPRVMAGQRSARRSRGKRGRETLINLRQRNSFHMSTLLTNGELDVLDRMIAEVTGKKNELAKMHAESKAS
jgi:hypothetical protein